MRSADDFEAIARHRREIKGGDAQTTAAPHAQDQSDPEPDDAFRSRILEAAGEDCSASIRAAIFLAYGVTLDALGTRYDLIRNGGSPPLLSLNSAAAAFGFTRRTIDDGRAPDPETGLPLETDAEYRAKLLTAIQAQGAPRPLIPDLATYLRGLGIEFEIHERFSGMSQTGIEIITDRMLWPDERDAIDRMTRERVESSRLVTYKFTVSALPR